MKALINEHGQKFMMWANNVEEGFLSAFKREFDVRSKKMLAIAV
jgi:hypothetical protein